MDIEKKVAHIALPILESMGMELVDVQYRREPHGWVLRLYIDKEGGVNLDDCSVVSGEVGIALDVEELIDHPYNIEVSSPGLTRPLTKLEDFIRFRGRQAKIKCYEEVCGKKKIICTLIGADEDDITVNMDGAEIKIPYRNIAKANLEISWEE